MQTTKALRDISRRKAQSVIIVAAVLVPVAGLTAVNVASDSLSSAYAVTLRQPGARSDVVVDVDRVASQVSTSVAQLPNVVGAQIATVVNTQWHVTAAPGHVPLRILGYRDLRDVPLTPFRLVAGTLPRPGGVNLEYGDVALQRFRVGDHITVDTAHGVLALRVDGIDSTPGLNPATSGVAVGYMAAPAARSIPAYPLIGSSGPRQPVRYDEITLRLHQPDAYVGVVHQLGGLLARYGSTVIGVVPPDHNAPVTQLRGILQIARLLLAIAVVLAALLIANAVTAFVADQITVIGTMKALGATRVRIVRGYLTTTLVYSAAATPLGIAAGIVLGDGLGRSMAASIPLATGPLKVTPATVTAATVAGVVVPALAALAPLWLGTRVTTHTALATWGMAGTSRSRRRFGAASAVTAYLPLTAWVGLRGVLRRPWQAAFSITTLTIAAVAFLAVQTLTSSVGTSVRSVWGSFAADVEIYVGGDHSYRQLTAMLDRVANVHRTERVGWYGTTTPWGKVSVWGVEPNSRIHHTRVISGRSLHVGDSAVCLLSADLAQRSHLQLGSTLDLTGPDGGHTLQATVAGVSDEPVDDISQVGAVDVPVNDLYRLEGAPLAAINDYTSRVVVQANDRSRPAVDRLTRAIDTLGRAAAANGKQGPVASVFTFRDEVTRHQRDFLPIYLMLYFAAAVVAGVGALGLADLLTASVVERRRDIGVLRALGASGRRIAAMFWVQGLALGMIAWVVACAVGIPASARLVQLFSDRVMPTRLHFDPAALALMVGSIVAVSSIATVVPARRAARKRTADLLRTE